MTIKRQVQQIDLQAFQTKMICLDMIDQSQTYQPCEKTITDKGQFEQLIQLRLGSILQAIINSEESSRVKQETMEMIKETAITFKQSVRIQRNYPQ